jgi:hypothetical protein
MAMLIADFLRHCKKYYGTGSNSEYHRYLPPLRVAKRFYAKHPAAQFGPTQLKDTRG